VSILRFHGVVLLVGLVLVSPACEGTEDAVPADTLTSTLTSVAGHEDETGDTDPGDKSELEEPESPTAPDEGTEDAVPADTPTSTPTGVAGHEDETGDTDPGDTPEPPTAPDEGTEDAVPADTPTSTPTSVAGHEDETGDADPGDTPELEEPEPPTAPNTLIPDGCEPRPAPGGGRRVENPNGPYSHQVNVALTEDGVTLDGAVQIIDHASVPDGVSLTDGSLVVYYVSGETGVIHVARVVGGSVEELGPISVDGVVAPSGAVDPDATLLPNGMVRLFYLGNFSSSRPDEVQSWYICAADSHDGVNFELVGMVMEFTGPQTTDPSVVELDDGTWLMAVSQGRTTLLARSVDGLNFEEYTVVYYGGIPELGLTGSGLVRLYVCANGIESYVSDDEGNTWTLEATNIAPGLGHNIVCDPSWVPDAGVFFYKTG